MGSALDVRRQLEDRFASPLEAGAERRIVIWHDEAGEFEEDFDAFAGSDAFDEATVRPVRYLKVEDGELFSTKLLISHGDLASDLLIYRKRAAGDLAGDWLADVELYAEGFQADHLSMLVDELGAVDTAEVRNALARYKGFFAAKDRKRRFVEVMPHVSKGDDVVIGALASVLGANPSSEEIIRSYGMALHDLDAEEGSKAIEALGRFGLEAAMARYALRVTGYAGDMRSFGAFMDHLLLSALSGMVPTNVMKGLEDAHSAQCSQFCLSIVHDWMEAEEPAREVLFSAARDIQERRGLELRFQEAGLDALLDADIFPAIDQVILQRLMSDVLQGVELRKEGLGIVAKRRGFRWGSRMSEFYDLVEGAMEMQAFRKAHEDGFACTTAKEAFDAYQHDWWRMDFAYRRFCEAYQRCVLADDESLIETAQELMEWGNNLYSNWFLPGVNDAWITLAAPLWEKSGCVEGVPLQRRFYADEVAPELKSVKRIAVIVSDAMRYAVAAQLKEKLERETRNSVALTAMQATFPSITSVGMASMLPHASLRIMPDGTVMVDGMKTVSTEQRQRVLDMAVSGSRAIQASALFAMTSQERKDLVANAPVTYIYHNVIDARGEKAATQSRVFDACEEAVEEVFSLTRMLVGSMGVSRVIVTADHGFLYTDRPLPEAERVSGSELGGEAWVIAERYALVKDEPASDLFVRVDMSMVSDDPLWGLAPRGCALIKRPGGGRYAHGGISLQELCVPVLHVKAAAKAGGAALAQAAALQLLDTNRRITSMLFGVRLYQPHSVSGKIAPCEYELVFVDKAGNAVSDVRHVVADRTADEPQERQMEARFSLKEGVAYTAADPYYLVVRRTDTGEQVWREAFTMEIAFAPVEDFGF